MIKTKESFTITYTEKDGLLYPDLTLPDQSSEDIGRFGRMRRRYLKEHRKVLYALLTAKCELNDHLREVNREAHEYALNLNYAVDRCAFSPFLAEFRSAVRRETEEKIAKERDAEAE